MPTTQKAANTSDDWVPVLGRSLALLTLHAEELRGAPLVDQWFFLERLGVPRNEAARILGTSDDSLRILAGRAKSRHATRS